MQPQSYVALLVLGQAALALAAPQEASGTKTLPPSPVGSGICEPHGDHCEKEALPGLGRAAR